MTKQGEEDPLDEVFSFIKRQRDELQLKVHLAQADAKDEWEKLEAKWEEIGERGEPLTGAMKEGAETVGEQAKNVAGAAKDVAMRELKEGYERLRTLMEKGD
ncbi:MAG: hypothetical protein AAGD22_08035 [Verrucomicrobiota bacterium]